MSFTRSTRASDMPSRCGLAPGHPLRLLPLALSGLPLCTANPITSTRRERSSNPGPWSSLLARRLSSRSSLLSCCSAIRLAFLAGLSTPPPVLRPITYPHDLAMSPRALDTASSAPPGAPVPFPGCRARTLPVPMAGLVQGLLLTAAFDRFRLLPCAFRRRGRSFASRSTPPLE